MKKAIRVIILAVIMAVGGFNQVQASHFAGADLTYVCLGGSSYKVTLSFYRDCSGINAPNTATVKFFCSSNPVFNFNVPMQQISGSGMEITSGCPQIQTSCGSGSGYGIREYVYQAVVTLPPCDEWTMYWNGGARNPITTLMSTGNWFIPAQLNNLDAPCNSSPTFSNKPIAITCTNQPFTFNHGAQDPDGDSLSYSFYAPYTGGPAPGLVSVIYNFGYSAINFLNSSTPIVLNPVTGDVTFTPTSVLNTVTGIRVDEWREINGVMKRIGSVYRDIQLKVVSCSNQLPVLSGMDTNLTATYDPNDTIYYLEKCRSNDPIKFHINGYDGDVYNPGMAGHPELFSISWDNGIPGASFNIHANGTDSAYGEFEWLPTANDVSTIPKCFTVKIQDGACAYNGIQTFSYCLVVRGMLVEIGTDTLLCQGEDMVVYADADTTTVNYVWFMNGVPTGTPLGQDSIVINSSTLPTGDNFLTIQTNDGTTTMACPGTDKIKIEVIYQPEISGTLPDSAFCAPGSGVTFDAGQGILYNWTDFSGASMGTSQTFTTSNSGVYQVFVDGGNNTRCTDRDTFIVAALTPPENITDTCIWLSTAPYIINIDKNYPHIDNSMIIEWQDGSNGTTHDVSVSGTYSVSVYHPTISPSVKCNSSGVVNVIDQDKIIEGIPYQATEDTPMPGAEWSPGDQEICAYQKIRFRGPTPPTGHSYTYNWTEDGSTVSNTDFYFMLKKENGSHILSLNVGGCEDKIKVDVISCDVIVPNIITPNNDGKNDKFKIMLTGDGAPEFFSTFPNSILIIYNRWGKKVYESNNYQNEWGGEDLTDGVYFWNLYLADGKDTEMKGTVTILKK